MPIRSAARRRSREIGSRRSARPLKGSGKAKSLADAAEKATRDPGALADLSREQGEYLDVVRNEWGPEGAERKKLRDAMATVQKNFERVNANLTKAAKATAGLKPSDVLEKAAPSRRS